MTISIYGQSNDNNYRIFDANGNSTNIDKIIEEIGKSDVVFLGEQHDDAVAHNLQMKILEAVYEKYGKQRKPVLSLEMFERDVQIILDEYLKNQISEAHFLSSSRPWGNYKTDYRPLIEFAKEKNIEVVAANAPRRYVNMVSRLGRDSLNGLSPEAKKWFAPLPFGEASAAYTKKFNALMGSQTDSISPHNPMLASQSFWDATMAYSIAENLKRNKNDRNALIVHLNGSFHTENRLGTVEHLLKYSPKTKILVVTMRYEDDFATFDKAKHTNLGDFVILTDAKVPRSQR
ncbi:MAG: ChaN family lipoprotein [Pyrinomonadaceae bacterium]|nr:ChaN family lipoprotein [Pyrinomonadaceae bacterium]